MAILISTLINFLTSLFLGLFILNKQKDTATKLFSLFTFSVAFWSLCYLLMLTATDVESVAFFAKLLTIFSVTIPLFYFHFTVRFTGIKLTIVMPILYLVAIFFCLLSTLSDLMVGGVNTNIAGFPFWPTAGPIYKFFLIYFFVLVLASVWAYVQDISFFKGVRKRQSTYLLIGTGVGFLGGMFNFPLWYQIPIEPYGNFLVAIYVVLTSYAIMKHRLLDIKLVLRKYSVYLSSLGTVVLFAYLLQYGWRYFFMNGGVISNLVIVALSVSLFPLIRRHYYHFANKYLFSSLYDSREVISTLSDKLRATLDLKTIYQSIFETLESAFHQKSFAIALFDAESKTYYSVYTNNISLSLDTIPSQAVCKFVVKYDKPFSLDDERIRIPAGFQVLQKAGIEVVNPLNLKGKCIALILLGQKESGDRYNEEDFSVLNITGTQAATAIDNARLYEEVKHFNEDLQKKVADATKKLQTQNEKLKELDKLKTEFISVASHQLRTPLTATKWALEFLLKGEDGKINAKQRESLNEMSLMNVRLITLVNELLNISRIDEGRLKIEPQPINIAVAVKDSLAELLPIARKKELNVVEHYDEVPSINLDPNVMTKAISNILSNAIKYNRDGKHLWVSVRKHKDSVSIIIKDEGIGIPKAEQGSLFQRFYRASNAASSNTEGTGLGLYIAKSVLEMSGGTITFESEEGVGTTFTIILPLKGSKARKGEKSLA